MWSHGASSTVSPATGAWETVLLDGGRVLCFRPRVIRSQHRRTLWGCMQGALSCVTSLTLPVCGAQVTADHTPPLVPAIAKPVKDGAVSSMDASVLAGTTSFAGTWTAFTDPESSITGYRVAATRCGAGATIGAVVGNWVSLASTARTASLSGLLLQSGARYERQLSCACGRTKRDCDNRCVGPSLAGTAWLSKQ